MIFYYRTAPKFKVILSCKKYKRQIKQNKWVYEEIEYR